MTQRTMTPKRITISQKMIDLFARGCPFNSPITVALKEQGFPSAREILIHGDDEIYVDGMPILPTLAMIRFIKDWNAGKKCIPMILGYHCE